MSGVFGRVVCGVDASDAGWEAARQAARVTDPEGTLTLVTVEDVGIAVHAGFQAVAVADELDREAHAAIGLGRLAADDIHPVRTRFLKGDPCDCLMRQVGENRATLVVVGSHDHSRALGIALGSVATHVLHEAPCSVLLARPADDPERWPRSIVVGVGGSRESAFAVDAAWTLADRFGASLRFVSGARDPVDPEVVRAMKPRVWETRRRSAATELCAASESADLVIVGSRGLTGLRALGSVSERVAHGTRCSVLVVRPGHVR